MQSESYLHDAEAVPSFRNGPHLFSASPMKHILAPTDLTTQSKESVACAVRLARGFQAKLTLLHVTPGSVRADTPFSPLYAGQLDLDAIRVLEESHKAERVLRVMRDRIRVHHALTEDCFLLGDPGPIILWVARECHVDLIVISTPHYNWLDRLFAGPESDKILRDACCSVLVVPSAKQESVDAGLDSLPLNARPVKASLAWASRTKADF
jgi:nucleotide-binding universal stress UspA family protein